MIRCPLLWRHFLSQPTQHLQIDPVMLDRKFTHWIACSKSLMTDIVNRLRYELIYGYTNRYWQTVIDNYIETYLEYKIDMIGLWYRQTDWLTDWQIGMFGSRHYRQLQRCQEKRVFLVLIFPTVGISTSGISQHFNTTDGRE